MIYTCIAIQLIYLIYLVRIAYLFIILRDESLAKATNYKTQVSVIIAYRNEAKALPKIIECIKLQTYHHLHFECIFVNDHSTDKSYEIISQSLPDNFYNLSLPEGLSGKKAAIAHGIAKATGTLILTTDADCFLKPRWIECIAEHYEKHNSTMIICPVVLQADNVLSYLQQIEFLALSALTGATASKKPLMCNGANLAFEKSAYLKCLPFLNETASGDDTFLMLAIRFRLFGKISFLKNSHAMVSTHACSHWQDLKHQRIRWALKTKYYEYKYIYTTGLFVVASNAALVAACIFCYWFPLISIGAIIIKFLADGIVIIASNSFFKLNVRYKYFFTLYLLYPIYSLFIFINTLGKTYQWRGRTYKM